MGPHWPVGLGPQGWHWPPYDSPVGPLGPILASSINSPSAYVILRATSARSGPHSLVVMMVLSSMLITWMTSAKKGFEALVIGILSGLFIGLFVTMSMQDVLSGNLSDITGSFEYVDVDDRAISASHAFVGTLVLWLNFMLELFRFKPEEELDL